MISNKLIAEKNDIIKPSIIINKAINRVNERP